MFPDGECLHATIKYAAQCITCIHIKPRNMIHIKCDLGFCDECPEYNIIDEEIDDGTNDSIINFSVYTYQGICTTYGIITNGLSVCILCEENDDIKNGLIKRPKYGKINTLLKCHVLLVNFKIYIINQY